jgi:hypothetical protein
VFLTWIFGVIVIDFNLSFPIGLSHIFPSTLPSTYSPFEVRYREVSFTSEYPLHVCLIILASVFPSVVLYTRLLSSWLAGSTQAKHIKMGRTSKFSFPMPGRKARSQQQQIQQIQPSEDLSLLPAEPKLSKVERLLGTTNLPSHYQTAHNQHPLQHDLRRQPSSITLTVYEPTIADAHSEFDYPISDVPIIPESSASQFDDDRSFNAPPRSLSLSQVHPPRHIAEETKRSYPRSQSSSAVPSIQQFRPNRSDTYSGCAYNAIQERPTTSNVRELALGRSSTSSGNAHKLFPVVENSANPDYPTGSYPVSGYKPGTTPAEKKRPTRLDLSKLFPRPSTSTGSALTKNVTSPTSAGFAHNPPRFPSDVRSPSDLASPPLPTSKSRRLAKRPSTAANRSTDFTSRPKTAGAADDRPPRLSRANPSKSRASKHWFDGLLEAEDDFSVDFTTEDQPQVSLNADHSIRPVEASPPYLPQAGYSQDSHAMLQQDHQHEQQFYELQHEAWQKLDSQTCDTPVAYDGATYRVRADSGHRAERTVRNQRSPMIAEFCSQEQTATEEIMPLELEDAHYPDLPDVRDSIALSDVDDDVVTIGEAQAFHVRHQRSLEAVETVQVKRVAQSHQFRVVNTSRSQDGSQESAPITSPRETTASSNKDAFFGSPQSVISGPPKKEYATVSRPESLTARASSIMTVGTQRSDHKHKMMAVTAEEEALLEMMRQKRAAMQSHSFAQGYKSAMMTSPQSPVFQNIQRDSGNVSIDSYPQFSTFHDNRAQLAQPSDCHPVVSSFNNQRRGSEPMVIAPKPTRVFKPQSTSTIDSSFCNSINAYRPSTSSHMVIPEDSFSTTPEMAHSALSTSPSEKSAMSGLPSPVTPHSLSTNHHVRVQVAVRSTNSESSNSITELAEDDVFDMQKAPLADIEVSHHRCATQSALFADVPLTADGIFNGEETPRVQQVKAAHIVQQHKQLASTYGSDEAQAVGQLYASSQASQLHEHHQGCCGSADAHARCSVADDVMAAWSSLGGWDEIERYQLY